MPEPRPLPISFSSFLVSLGHTALEQLGEGQGAADPSLARQTIDLIAVLQEKTQGNLDTEEQRLMDALLYELRTKYVALTGGA